VASPQVKLPPGFVLDGPSLPEGFVLDSDQQNPRSSPTPMEVLHTGTGIGMGKGSGDAIDRFGKRIGSNIVDMGKGLASTALDAAKSALTVEGHVGYLPRLAKNLYQGAVNYGSDAIARQLPRGAEDISPREAIRAGVAAVPVVGGYAMNRVSDFEEGKGPEALADITTDVVSMMVPGTPTGRALAGSALKGTGKAALATAKGAGKVAAKVGPEVAGTVAGAAISGSTGGIVGGVIAHQTKSAVVEWFKKRYKLPAKQADDIVSKLKPAEIQRIAAENLPPQAIIPEGAIRVSPMTTTAPGIRPIPPNRLPPVLPDPVIPEKIPSMDVVTAKPAFPGQQGAKGATKARFEMIAERLAKKPKPPNMADVAEDLDKWVFKDRLSDQQIIARLKRAYGIEKEAPEIVATFRLKAPELKK
jgi:hypothetical protein